MKKQDPKAFATVASELERVQAQIAAANALLDDPEKAVREALAREDAKRIQRDVNDFRQCLMRPEGRRVIYRIIEESKTFAQSFVPGKSDVTAYNEGQRNIGIFVMKLAEAAEPGICLRMANESASDKTVRDTKQKKILETVE